MNVKIYTITPIWRGRPPKIQTRYYSLMPYHPRYWYCKGRDDGGRVYELPEGYRLAETQHGYSKFIQDSHDWICKITRAPDGSLELRGYDIPPAKLLPAKPWAAPRRVLENTREEVAV